MPEKLKKQIAQAYYVESYTQDTILKLFKIRPKTLKTILEEYKDEFVREGGDA